LDLGDFENIDKFVVEFKKLNLPLNILINNAGVFHSELKKTKDGFEAMNGINHLGHFRLTLLLLPLMIKTSGFKKIIMVSSDAHEFVKSKIDFDNFNFTKPDTFSMFPAYGQSKLCNLQFAC